MSFSQYVREITAVLILIFYAGIVARIIKIIMDGQVDPDQPTGKMVLNHIKAGIIITLAGSLVIVIKGYFK